MHVNCLSSLVGSSREKELQADKKLQHRCELVHMVGKYRPGNPINWYTWLVSIVLETPLTGTHGW